ncbi:MAG: hypothetical protein H6Q58_485 [Firmicutes bacterium]|nr:hypothetical protein [Bacillota bacterium]
MNMAPEQVVRIFSMTRVQPLKCRVMVSAGLSHLLRFLLRDKNEIEWYSGDSPLYGEIHIEAFLTIFMYFRRNEK